MKCQALGCDELATHTVYWPGQTTRQCKEHATRVIALGLHLGFKVDTTPIQIITDNLPPK